MKSLTTIFIAKQQTCFIALLVYCFIGFIVFITFPRPAFALPWQFCCEGTTPGCRTYDPDTGWVGVCSTFQTNECTIPPPSCYWTACSCPGGSQNQICTNACGSSYVAGSRACTPTVTISGTFSGAPQAIQVCTGTNCSSASTTNYSLTVAANQTYSLVPSSVPGYCVTPNPGSATVSCSNVTGPTFSYPHGSCNNPPSPSQPGDAGVGVSLSSINSGSGQISENGTSPGYRLENYTDQTPLDNINFTAFLTNILKNTGLGTTANLESQAGCQPGSTVSTTKADFYCYTTATFDSVFQTAVSSGNSNKTLVLYPRSDLGIGQQTMTSAKSISGRQIVVLVNGTLEVQANVTVSENNSSGLLTILNNPANPSSNGDLLVDSPVTRLDGVYIFPGSFTDTQGGGATTAQLLGNGSLLGIGTGTFTTGRTSTPGPGEQWTYETKYLTMFANTATVTKYTWQELPPQ